MPCAPLTPDFRRRGGTRRRAPTQNRPCRGRRGPRRCRPRGRGPTRLLTSPSRPRRRGAIQDRGATRHRSRRRRRRGLVLSLAGLIAISGLTPTAPFFVVVGQWGRAGGAICEDHLYKCALGPGTSKVQANRVKNPKPFLASRRTREALPNRPLLRPATRLHAELRDLRT